MGKSQVVCIVSLFALSKAAILFILFSSFRIFILILVIYFQLSNDAFQYFLAHVLRAERKTLGIFLQLSLHWRLSIGGAIARGCHTKFQRKKKKAIACCIFYCDTLCMLPDKYELPSQGSIA